MAIGIKKLGDAYDTDTAWYREQVAIAERQNREHVAKFDRSFNGIMAKADAKSRDLADGDEIDRRNDGGVNVGSSDHRASKVADLLVEAGTHPDRSAALDYLMHSPHGAALLHRMSKAADQTERETTMTSTHAEFVRDVVKQYGVVALAKSMVQEQKAYGLDEHEFTKLATEHATRVYPSDRPDTAFGKLYEAEESVRRACQVAKAQTLEPVMVGGVAATHEAINNTEQSEAYAQLEEMASKLRASSPFLSTGQAFARAAEQRPDLLAKAHVRPVAPAGGIYAYPR